MKSLAIIAFLLLAACNPLRRPVPNPDPGHTHADFAVWIEGQKMDFSDEKYMSGSSKEEEEGEHPHPHLHEYLHLHDGVSEVIHRHKPGLTLGEFFSSLGFRMEQTCFVLDTKKRVCHQKGKEWRMYVNGELRPFDQAYVFEDTDKILLTYGSGGDQVAKELVALIDEACRYSKTCPWRGQPPVENCVADPEVPCRAPLD